MSDLMCTINESRNNRGPSMCSVDEECLGQRECSPDGKCEGESGCEQGANALVKLGACERDESKTVWGPGKCAIMNDCRGARWCRATGVCVGVDLCDSPLCDINEYENFSGPGKCMSDAQCRGQRYCNWAQKCDGISYCPFHNKAEVAPMGVPCYQKDCYNKENFGMPYDTPDNYPGEHNYPSEKI